MIVNRARMFLALLFVLVYSGPLSAADTAPQDTNWLSYNHNINGQRYAPIAQINTAKKSQAL